MRASNRNHLTAILLFILTLPTSSMVSLSGDLDGAVRELSGKLAIVLGPTRDVALAVQNASSLSHSEFDGVRRALEAELVRRGIRFVEVSDRIARVVLTVSENIENYLLVAEIRRGDMRDVVMITRPRLVLPARKNRQLPVSIERRFLFEQEDPILDLVPLGDDLLILDPSHLSLYRRQDERWEKRQVLSLPMTPTPSRDIRGRLTIEATSFRAYLPGLVCNGLIEPSLSMVCNEGDVSWPNGFGTMKLVKGRNFFVANNVPPFYTVATVEDGANSYWLFAGVEGRTHVYDKTLKPVRTFAGWGSDIAGAETRCGTGSQVLATLRNSTTEASLQAFEIVNREPVAVSARLELPGIVTALWPVENKGGAVVVSRDPGTGRYAAFHLSLSCGS